VLRERATRVGPAIPPGEKGPIPFALSVAMRVHTRPSADPSTTESGTSAAATRPVSPSATIDR